jgi:hypothetical protein
MRGVSKFFVTCFGAEGDDLNQWNKYARNGYAISFYAQELWREWNGGLYRVVYDKEKQECAAKALAEAALRFYLDGLKGERLKQPKSLAQEFFAAWDEWAYKLTPLVKDTSWKSESEFRIVHELTQVDLPLVRFAQKKTMLSRYLALTFSNCVKNRMPIAKIIVGPGNHPAFTRTNAKLLLDQMGYSDVPVEITNCTFTEP